MEERLGEVIGSFLNALFGLVEVVNAAKEEHNGDHFRGVAYNVAKRENAT